MAMEPGIKGECGTVPSIDHVKGRGYSSKQNGERDRDMMHTVADECSEIAVKSQPNMDESAGQEEVKMSTTCLKSCSQWSEQNKEPEIEGRS
ncbi:uncharacterized [Tachysurus ichikawai]